MHITTHYWNRKWLVCAEYCLLLNISKPATSLLLCQYFDFLYIHMFKTFDIFSTYRHCVNIFIQCSSQYFHQMFVSWRFDIFNTVRYFQLFSQYFDEVFISLYFQREINVYLEWKFSDGRNFYRADYRISNVRGHFFISKSS